MPARVKHGGRLCNATNAWPQMNGPNDEKSDDSIHYTKDYCIERIIPTQMLLLLLIERFGSLSNNTAIRSSRWTSLGQQDFDAYLRSAARTFLHFVHPTFVGREDCHGVDAQRCRQRSCPSTTALSGRVSTVSLKLNCI